MKKTLLTAIICVMTATSPLYGQHTQSVAFSGPTNWTPGTMITLSVNLTYGGYSSFGYSLWLEVNNALAPHLSILSHINFVFTNPNNVSPKPAPFNLAAGANAGFMTEPNDMGGTTAPNYTLIAPGTYHVVDITFMLDGTTPAGTYTLASTNNSPKVSEVADTDFNSNAIPRATFTFTVVPEPSTVALLGIGAAGSGVLIYRRRKHHSSSHSTNDIDLI